MANLDFITAAMTSDHNNGKFASTRPRGAFFRMNDEKEGDEGQDERRDDDGDERDGSADNKCKLHQQWIDVAQARTCSSIVG